jgi:hypothetical protein
VRALEQYRAAAGPDDPFVRRCAAAMAAAARRCRPVRLRVTGLTLTAGTVMASAEPLDGEAWRFMSVLDEELVEYVSARRVLDVGECVADWTYLVRFEHVPGTGMRPVLLSQAAFGPATAMDESRSITVGRST